jgi:hypothetical protein
MVTFSERMPPPPGRGERTFDGDAIVRDVVERFCRYSPNRWKALSPANTSPVNAALAAVDLLDRV